MYYKRLLLSVALCLLWLPTSVSADTTGRLLLIYMTADGEMNERVVMAEANISHFVGSIDVVSAGELSAGKVQTYQHVVFIGDEEGDVPPVVLQELHRFEGTFLLFGYNAEQFSLFTGWEFPTEQSISSVDGQLFDASKSVVETIPPQDAEILATAKTVEQSIPFIVKKERVAYVATSVFNTDEKYVLSRALYTIFDVRKPSTHPAYIRLDGISPISDAEEVREVAEYLLEQRIPFMLSVIPVYLNEKKGERVQLSSNKKLVATLRSLQARGASIVVSGYNRTFRDEEDVAGFEFWDQKFDQPIISDSIDPPPPLPVPSRFVSDEAYADKRAPLQRVETDYINVKLRLSIERLAPLGLYPVAFDVPNYTMSANGYRVVADYFSALVGRMQVSDTTAKRIDMPLFITKPYVLAGMKLYPETLGYIDPELADPLREVKQNLKQLETVPGSVLGVFYPIYLGTSYLAELVYAVESVPGVKWLDFSKTSQYVQTENVEITQTAEELHMDSSITKFREAVDYFRENPFNSTLWIVAAIVMAFLLAFTIHALSLRLRLKKRLFEEREHLD